jgi:hypothetical protein
LTRHGCRVKLEAGPTAEGGRERMEIVRETFAWHTQEETLSLGAFGSSLNRLGSSSIHICDKAFASASTPFTAFALSKPSAYTIVGVWWQLPMLSPRAQWQRHATACATYRPAFTSLSTNTSTHTCTLSETECPGLFQYIHL